MDSTIINGFAEELILIKEAVAMAGQRPTRPSTTVMMVSPGKGIAMRGQAGRDWTQRAQLRSKIMPLKATRSGTMLGSATGGGVGALAGRGLAGVLKASPIGKGIGTALGAATGFLAGGHLGGYAGAKSGLRQARKANIIDAARVAKSQRQL